MTLLAKFLGNRTTPVVPTGKYLRVQHIATMAPWMDKISEIDMFSRLVTGG